MAPGAVPSSPGLLVRAKTANSAVPGTTADAGIGGGEATDSTERALGPGRGSRTGCQVVGSLGHTQVLQRHRPGSTTPLFTHVANTHQGQGSLWVLLSLLGRPRPAPLSPAPPARPENFFESEV